jgi:hypothetical protein
MSTVDEIVEKLVNLDTLLNELKEQKKNVDDEVKDLEEQLIQYCRENDLSIESVTQGQYNVKPNTGRKLKKK